MDYELQAGIAIEPKLQRHLAEIFSEHGRETTELAFFLTGEPELAQDLAQEAFVRLFGRFSNVRNPDAVRVYLRRTVVNLARSHFRKRKTERSYAARLTGSGTANPSIRDVDQEEDMLRLLQLIPDRQRAALILRFYFDLSESQTAETLGVSDKTVNGLVRRGLTALRKKYEVPNGD